ncbi:50S ribosomal protein L6 [Candidatus Peregrinibacteria bacterium]|nr:MAG: 50S ribosomal protein L6 [Candidatus Peregrinibacteria bacterium]
MSRIGNNPIDLQPGVTVEIKGSLVTVKGSRGELSYDVPSLITVKQEESTIVVTRANDEKEAKSLHGLVRMLVNNMIVGVSKGYEKRLEIHGVGYRAVVDGNLLKLTLGFSHPVEMDIPSDLKVSMDEKEKNEIIVEGIDKQRVGQFSADIRDWRKPEPYKGKGIRYKGEYVRRKAGKAAKK